jgi:protein-disulfide isomerase
MTSFTPAGLIALSLLVLSCSPDGGGSSKSASGGETEASAAGSGDDRVAARVAGRTITVGEVDRAIESELARLEMQRYQARRRARDQMVDQALVAAKAKELGVADDALFQKEVGEKVKPPSDAEIRAYYDKNKDRIPQKFEEVAPRIQQALFGQAMQARQQEFVSGLRKESDVEIALAPPRIEIPLEAGITSGPADAPITLVEFSDYQCPFCARSQETVERVLEKYGDKVRHVFMDFPIERIHPQAKPAAIAGRCAADQDKFREYHALLFENLRELTRENFDKWAKELGLDTAAFSACLDSGKHVPLIEATLAAGQEAGVTGTPAFFVNGVMVSGAQPFEVFEELIDEELERQA